MAKVARKIAASVIGNAIEWYDFAVFGFLAPITDHLFVSASNTLTSLIYVYLLFAIGFISRPIGGIVFGYIGDHYGRTSTLRITIWLMSLPTVVIGLLPTYATWGIFTPLSIGLLRFLQGIALGGEYTGAIIYMTETAPTKNQALFSSIVYTSATAGILIGSSVVTLNAHLFDTQTLYAWAWRLPFLLPLLFSFFGYYLRKNLPEPRYNNKLILHNHFFKNLFKQHYKKFLTTIRLDAFNAIGFYIFFIFTVTYFHSILHIDINFSLLLNTAALLLLSIMMPVSGYLADRFGNKKILFIAGICLLFTIPLAFTLFSKSHLLVTSVIMLLLALFFGLAQGTLPSTYVRLFPKEIRASGLSISYNISNALFGGTAPAMAVWLIKTTGSIYAVVAYLLIALIISLFTLRQLPQYEID